MQIDEQILSRSNVNKTWFWLSGQYRKFCDVESNYFHDFNFSNRNIFQFIPTPCTNNPSTNNVLPMDYTAVYRFDLLVPSKDVMQGKLFQRCTHFLYCSVLSLGGKVNTRRMSQPDKESIFTKIIYEIFLS